MRHVGVNPITGRRAEAVLMNSRSPGSFPNQREIGQHFVGGPAIMQSGEFNDELVVVERRVPEQP